MNKGVASPYDVVGRAIFSQQDQWVSCIQGITQGNMEPAREAVGFFMRGLEESNEYSLTDKDIWKLFYESVRMAQLIGKGEIRRSGPDFYLIEQVPIKEIADQLGLEFKAYPGEGCVYFTRKHKLSFEDIMIPEE